MTEQEALDEIMKATVMILTDNRKFKMAIKQAVTALKKQIPYKPAPYQQYCGKCRCGAVFLDKHTKYCGNCGQALDWEDKNETN